MTRGETVYLCRYEAAERGLRVSHPSDRGVVVIELARPERRNALNAATSAELARQIAEVGSSGHARALVITGSGTAFCSGDDLQEIGTAGAEDFRRNIEGLQQITAAVAESPVPVVAAINGPAFGAGLELTLACDFRLAGRSATFCLPEMQWGLTITNGASVFLPMLIGPDRTRQMIFDGTVFTSAWAKSAGLVSDVVEDNELIDRALDLAARLAALPSAAVAVTRKLLGDATDLQTVLQRETEVACAMWATEFSQQSLKGYLARHKGRK